MVIQELDSIIEPEEDDEAGGLTGLDMDEGQTNNGVIGGHETGSNEKNNIKSDNKKINEQNTTVPKLDGTEPQG